MTATKVFVTKADLAQLRYLSPDQVKTEILDRQGTMTNRYTIQGVTDEHDTCDCCGKANLKRTIALADAEQGGTVVFFGTSCAARAMNVLDVDVQRAARAADKARDAAEVRARKAKHDAEFLSWVRFLMERTGGRHNEVHQMIEKLGGFKSARAAYVDHLALAVPEREPSPDLGLRGPELKEPAKPADKGNMNIKAITVVVEKRDVSISRTNTPHARQAHAVQVQVVIHHPNQRNVAVPYTVTGEDVDLKAAQTIIERATSQGWEKTHTTSMVRDLVDVLRSVAGV